MNTQSVGSAQADPQSTRSYRFSTFESMVCAKRWLLASPDKVPHYINGTKRHGELDTSEDRARLARYHDAKVALEMRGDGWLLGFALGPDGTGGYWQGIDFDNVSENRLADLANAVPGYVEKSPSGKGAHAIGYGAHLAALGPNGTGIEAYAGGRFFTVTPHLIRDSAPVCLASYVEQTLAPHHRARRSTSTNASVELVPVDDSTKRDLRSALQSMRADDYHLWIRMGMAVRELGDDGRALWMEWSSSSEKFEVKQAARKWESFKPSTTGYQAVFAEARRHGWLNPASATARPSPLPATSEESGAVLLEHLSIDWTDGSEAEVTDIVLGLVADEDVTLLGGHGGHGKLFSHCRWRARSRWVNRCFAVTPASAASSTIRRRTGESV